MLGREPLDQWSGNRVTLRGDAYSVNGLSNLSNPDLPSAFFSQNGMPPIQHVPGDFFAARAFPQMGLTWDYPVVRHGDPLDLLIEPMVAKTPSTTAVLLCIMVPLYS